MAFIRAFFLLTCLLTFGKCDATGHHFVLVHGFGHGAWCWYKVTTLLQQAGDSVTAIDLTSNGINKAIADDVTTVAQYTQPLTHYLATNVTSQKKVILVGHSLGGSSISYATEIFPNKISKAIFLAALMPSNNETFIQPEVDEILNNLIQKGVVVRNYANELSAQPTSAYINLVYAKAYFYNKSALEDVYLAYTLLNPTSLLISEERLKLTAANYGSIERFYIKTSLDRAVPLSVQENLIHHNPPKEVFMLENSDHSAFFSQPIALTELLISIAAM